MSVSMALPVVPCTGALMRLSGGAAISPLAFAAVAAYRLRDSTAGRTLTAPMLAFCFALALSNVGLLPAAHPLYDACATMVLPFSVALGLLSSAALQPAATARGGRTETPELRPMMLAFAIGAVGSVCGSLAAWTLCSRFRLLAPPAAACAAGLMAATYVGGSANFFGTATATRAASHPGLLPSLLAADLGLMGVYLVVLAAAARSPTLLRGVCPHDPHRCSADEASTSVAESTASDIFTAFNDHGPLTAAASAVALMLAGSACIGAAALERSCRVAGSGMVALCAATSVVGAALAARAPEAASLIAAPLRDMALLLGCLFLASLGASARLAQLLSAGPAAVIFSGTVLLVHCTVMLAGVAIANRLGARIPAASMLLASNANVGGSGTAVAMAGALDRPNLVAPAAACGTLGYAVATGLGVALHGLLLPGQ